jgi:hypothetical protein
MLKHIIFNFNPKISQQIKIIMIIDYNKANCTNVFDNIAQKTSKIEYKL